MVLSSRPHSRPRDGSGYDRQIGLSLSSHAKTLFDQKLAMVQSVLILALKPNGVPWVNGSGS